MGGFLYWWQHLPERMNPVLFHLGALRVQWYGLMYIVAFMLVYLLASRRIKTEPRFAQYDDEFLKNILTYGFIGVLAGGRIGYVLFYNFGHYLHHPLEIILPFSFDGGFRFTGISGMSYHGGITGCVVACFIFCRKFKADFWNLCDLFFPVAPLGYTFGRLGNFINGELYGRVTDAAIGMHFPESPDPSQLRHPSQLYEAFFEGIALFFVLYSLRKLRLPKGAMSALYIFGYGFVRFNIEFFRQPDSQLGFVLFNMFSRGQELCFAMMAIGVGLFLYLRVREHGAARAPQEAKP
jgi:phosphatidylglycerol:prolipoprotein diacylglycerol transferase